jgi:hypothetical protein
MWFTALLPPPPIPITFRIDDCSLGKSKCIIVGSSISPGGFLFVVINNPLIFIGKIKRFILLFLFY